MGNIKELREKYGLTRQQFSDAFSIPYRTLQSWELGVRSCPVYVFRMMEMLLYLSERTGGLKAFREGAAVGTTIEDST